MEGNDQDSKVIKMPRQQDRAKQREDFKKSEKLRKEMNGTVRKGEVLMWVNGLNQKIDFLEKRLARTELMLAAAFRLFETKQLWTDEDVEGAVEHERQRGMAFSDIEKQKGNYRERIEKCKEWAINLKATVILSQIKFDKELTEVERKSLAKDFDIALEDIMPPVKKDEPKE